MNESVPSFWARLRQVLFTNRSVRQTVAKNTAWLTLGTVFSRVIRAVLIIYAARLLGTENYGVFSYALSLAAFFSVFSDIGLGGLLTRESVKHPEKTQEYLSTALVIRLVLLGPVVILMFLAGDLLSKVAAAKELLPFIALLLIFDNLRNFGFSITRAQNRMELEAVFSVLTDVFITGIGLIVLFFHPGATALSAAYALGSGLGFAGIALALGHYSRAAFSHFKGSLVKPLLSAAWPFAVMGVLSGLLINIDTLVIGWFRSTHELGLYAAAQRPIQILYAIPAIVSSSLFPMFSRFTQEHDTERLRRLSEKSITAILALALPLMVGGIILGRALMVLLFGAPYEAGTHAFQLLMLTMGVAFTSAITSNFIFAQDRQKVFLLSSGLGAGANLALDLLLIPRWGITGSAVATLISQILLNAVLWIAMKRLNYFSVLPHMKKIMFATAVMGVATIAFQASGLHVLLNVGLSALLYFGLLKVLKEPLVAEVRSLTKI